MKKIFILTAMLITVFTASITAQTVTPPKQSGPEIKLIETSYDFGSINEGTLATHEFIFSNTGDSDLILQLKLYLL